MTSDEFAKFTGPFKKLYEKVTDEIQLHPVYQQPRGFPRDWLETIVRDFWREFDSWGSASRYSEYFKVSEQRNLKSPLLHVVVCAYLHISYDLPRILAEDWPDKDRWPWYWPFLRNGKHAKMERLYFSLAPIFPRVFKSCADDTDIVGAYGRVSSVLPPRMTHDAMLMAASWALHLRSVAWIHGCRLASEAPIEREASTARMMQAMVAALEDVTDNPLTAGRLQPPHDHFWAFAPLPLGALTIDSVLNLILSGALIATSAVFYYALRRERLARKEVEEAKEEAQASEQKAKKHAQASEQRMENLLAQVPELEKEQANILKFIQNFGSLVSSYTHLALVDPVGFDKFLERRKRF